MKQNLFFRFLSGSWLKIAGLSLLGALGSACGVYMALISKRVIDVATGQAQGEFLPVSLVLAGLLLFQLLLQVLRTMLHVDTITKLRYRIQGQLFERFLHKQKQSVDRFHSGEFVNRISGDSAIVAEGAGNLIPTLITVVTRIVFSFCALVALDSTLAVLCVLAGAVVLMVAQLYRKKTGVLFKESRECEGRVRSYIQEIAQNLTVVKAFSVFPVAIRQLNRSQDEAYRLAIRKNRVSIIAHVCFFLAMTAGYYLALSWGAWKISKGLMTFGTLTAVLGLTGDVTVPFRDLASLFPQYMSVTTSSERLDELWKLPEEENLPPADTKELYEDLKAIRLQQVDFSYGIVPVLYQATAAFQKNKLTAITGESGAGKSTLLNLLIGLLQPEGGQLVLETEKGDVPLTGAHRGLFAYVPQDFLLLSGNVIENITLFDETPDMDRFWSAIRAAELTEVVEELPQGLETHLGEGGGRLSGGQRQRMAIARALYSPAQVLLMDESTSALSGNLEEKILRHIRESGHTVIFVTHRRTASEACDCVFHMENGRITLM